MVYMSGSSSSRNQTSIINRTNTCGGIKKSGLGYTGVGPTKGSGGGVMYFRVANSVANAKCGLPLTKNPTQAIGYRATLGSI
jgi:hypothetical protein